MSTNQTPGDTLYQAVYNLLMKLQERVDKDPLFASLLTMNSPRKEWDALNTAMHQYYKSKKGEK
jgi:hypothetical protein